MNIVKVEELPTDLLGYCCTRTPSHEFDKRHGSLFFKTPVRPIVAISLRHELDMKMDARIGRNIKASF